MSKKQSKNKVDEKPELLPATKLWVEKVQGDFVLDSHHTMLLTLAAKAYDRAQIAFEDIQKNGQTFLDRFGVSHASPSCKIELDSSNLFARLLRELCLDIEGPEKPRIPVITKGIKCR